jgi:hypothetical protein
MLDHGEVASMAELARMGRVSRARITQIMDLLLLAPEIQEEVLFGRDARGLRELMAVCRRELWSMQRVRWTVGSRDPLRRELAKRPSPSRGASCSRASDLEI